MEQVVATFYKNAREQVQVILKDFKGHDLIDLRVFWTQDGKVWHPSKKGLALTVEKLPMLLGALQKAAGMVGQLQPEMVDDDFLTDAERSKLSEMFKLDQERIEEIIFD
jgi:hypothetical protein